MNHAAKAPHTTAGDLRAIAVTDVRLALSGNV